MAVHTPISQNDLIDFLKLYDIGNLISYKGIAAGIENSNFFVQTTRDKYILTLFEQRVTEADLPFYMQLMQYLAQNDISCPQPMKTKSGTFYDHLNGRPAAFVSFLSGAEIARPEARHCASLGAQLAKFHLTGVNFPLQRANSLAQPDWLPLWQQGASYSATYSQELADKTNLVDEIDRDLKVLAKDWPQSLPKGIIHADLFPDNVFFIDDEVSGFIDFYFSCYDSLAYDIAVCLNAWCFNLDFSYNLDKARHLLAAYQKVRPLSLSEQQALPMLAHGAAMRFFLTRFYDWYHTPKGSEVQKKDPLEYLQKLRFFRQINNSQALGL